MRKCPNYALLFGVGFVLTVALVAIMLTRDADIKKAQIAAQPTSKIFLFRYSPSHTGFNYVGNDWSHTCLVNGKPASAGKRFTLSVGETVEIEVQIVEDDEYPDVGKKKFKHKVTVQDMTEGFMMEGNITVTENGGRYRGNKCTWKVSVGFSPFR